MTEPSPKPEDLLSRSLSRAELPPPEASLALLARAQQGSREALEDLVSRYQDRIRRIVRIQLGSSILRRQYDSMDIVQSTFRAALPKIGDLIVRSPAGLLQWLSLIATNQIRDAYDHQHAEKRDARRDEPLCSGHGIAANGVLPDDHAQLAEIRELLDEEVSRLPESQRRVVVLRDYCDEDWDRIATELDRDNGAARQLHQRAWIRLRAALRPKLGGRGHGNG